MASIHHIKRRIKSIEGTRQITQAMELVSASKMVKAKRIVEKSRPYYEQLHQTLTDIASLNWDFSSEYTNIRKVKRACCVLIGGDRGLAGGYNANLFKDMERQMEERRSCCFVPIGKKAIDYCQRTKKDMLTDLCYSVEEMKVSNCFQIGLLLAKAFVNHEFDELYVAYTAFTSMLEQTPTVLKLLPVYREDTDIPKKPSLIIYDPSAEAVYDAIIPSYLGGFIYGAVCEASASELAARRAAMNTATKNAKDMISDLNLQYNRIRQGQITQEITEIIAGSGN